MKCKFVYTLLSFLIFPILLFSENILLKSGENIQNKIIEKTDKYIKIDFSGIPLTYYWDDIESIDGIKINASPTNTKIPKEYIQLSNGLKIIPNKNMTFSDTPTNNNAILHYKDGKTSEVKITRKLKNEIMIEATPGVEIGIYIYDLDSIETNIPDVLTNRYTNDKYGITAQGPEDWVMITPTGYYLSMLQWDDSQLVYFHKYPIEEARLNDQVDPYLSIVVDKNYYPGINNTSDYAYLRIKVLKKIMRDLKVLTPPSDIILKEKKWTRLEIESVSFNTRQMNYFLLKENLIYWISFGAPPDSFESELPTFDKIVNNIDIE